MVKHIPGLVVGPGLGRDSGKAKNVAVLELSPLKRPTDRVFRFPNLKGDLRLNNRSVDYQLPREGSPYHYVQRSFGYERGVPKKPNPISLRMGSTKVSKLDRTYACKPELLALVQAANQFSPVTRTYELGFDRTPNSVKPRAQPYYFHSKTDSHNGCHARKSVSPSLKRQSLSLAPYVTRQLLGFQHKVRRRYRGLYSKLDPQATGAFGKDGVVRYLQDPESILQLNHRKFELPALRVSEIPNLTYRQLVIQHKGMTIRRLAKKRNTFLVQQARPELLAKVRDIMDVFDLHGTGTVTRIQFECVLTFFESQRAYFAGVAAMEESNVEFDINNSELLHTLAGRIQEFVAAFDGKPKLAWTEVCDGLQTGFELKHKIPARMLDALHSFFIQELEEDRQVSIYHLLATIPRFIDLLQDTDEHDLGSL